MKVVRGIAFLTADEMRRVDEAAISEFGIDVLSLMENAGVQTALQTKRMLGGSVAAKRIVCLVGKGNNGGDGLVAARHLSDWGASVEVALSARRTEFRDVPSKQLAAVEKLGVAVTEGESGLEKADLVIDALLGYNSTGDPRGVVADLIRLANVARRPTLALDIPSGLDPSSGVPNRPCVVANSTITLGFPKLGFLNPESRKYVGELWLCDISLPRRLYASQGEMGRIFESDSAVRVPLG
jgi:NAD(P)H-hydrate epimerase